MSNKSANGKGAKKSAPRHIPVSFLLLTLALAGGCLSARGHAHLHDRARALYHHFRSAQAQQALAATLPTPSRADAPLVVYGGVLGDGWQDWSWATHTLQSSAPTHSGHASVTMAPRDNQGLYFHHDGLSTVGYGALEFYLHGAAALTVCLVDGDKQFKTRYSLKRFAPKGDAWAHVVLPLALLGIDKGGESITGVSFQADGKTQQPAVGLADIRLLPDLALPLAPTQMVVPVSVDARADIHPISPLVYGMAFAPASYLTDLRLGVNRWGGNDKSRYNWVQGNACNAARDWGWRNRKAVDADLPPGPSSAADRFVAQNQNTGTASLLTIPTLGWVARDSDNNHASQNVPNGGGPPLSTADGAIDGYNPAANRALTSVPSLARKGRAFDLSPAQDSGPVYEDEWVNHLKTRFGSASHGGVRLYAMDNEPDLWDSTHADVHPARMGYDDLLHTFLDYATAVKAVDPDAQITGPVSWGWTGYEYSPLDRGDDNYHTHADMNRHNGQWFVPWFLSQVHAHDHQTGRRTLDVLDIHFYPQGDGLFNGASSATDPDANARRLRAVRALWDPAYQDESWIAQSIHLIPRMKQWVGQSYPGTKLAITEWNFGADATLNGGLAAGDALGVFGREGLDMACYWAYPPEGSPAYLAFKLFRNADGQGHGFGDIACRAVSVRSDMVSAYAAQDSRAHVLTIVLFNKSPHASATVPLALGHWTPGKSPVQSWRVSADTKADPAGARLRSLPGVAWPGTAHILTLPPYSMTLLRIPGR